MTRRLTDREWRDWLYGPLPLADRLRIEIDEARYQGELAAFLAAEEADAYREAELRERVRRTVHQVAARMVERPAPEPEVRPMVNTPDWPTVRTPMQMLRVLASTA